MTISLGAAGIYSDDFQSNSTLDSEWTHELGASSQGTYSWWGQGTGDAGITMEVPSGIRMDVWSSGFNGNAIHQSCTDNDFTIETRWTTDGPSEDYEYGMFIASAALADYATIQLYGTGTTLFSGENSTATTWTDGGATVTDRRLRMVHTASSSTIQTQYWNGSTWTNHGSGSVSWTAARVGLWAGSYNPTNGFDMNCDYFFEITATIVPEDGTGGAARKVMVIS